MHWEANNCQARVGRRRFLLWLLLSGGRLSLQPALGELPKTVDEYELKAAFLYKLAKFVRWPEQKFEGPASPLVIGVSGAEALERFERVLRDNTLDLRPVQVSAVHRPEDAFACHIVFVSRVFTGSAGEWAESGRQAGTLMTGETAGFLEAGGMLRFYTEAGELRLELNENRARKAGLCVMASALSTLVNKGIAKIRNL